jgi:hypothetical protein
LLEQRALENALLLWMHCRQDKNYYDDVEALWWERKWRIFICDVPDKGMTALRVIVPVLLDKNINK